MEALKKCKPSQQLLDPVKHNLTSYSPNGGMAVYYLGRGVDAYGNSVATPFPEGFKMLSGDSNTRIYDNDTMTWGNETYPPTQVANRVTFACLNYADEPPQAYNMSSTDWYSALFFCKCLISDVEP